ncbi:hypothetical protein CU098_003113 [Rhizopus stolonifer]|uniref:Uncharacterized protein n=2 Tax=Mucorineae TaxID=1344963 RepID=A0A367K127_RHIST|nr:hypothetical protein CU098_003113 [Rhizopus stolonifer]
MDQFFTFCTQGSQQHNIWLYELEHSSSIIYLNYIHPSDNLAQLKHTLDYASSLSQHKSTAHTTKSVLSSDENLHRIISRLSNEIQMLKQQKGRESTSTYSEGPRNISMFSSVSNSTSATILTDEKFDHDIHDLHRQIEELENQVTVTRERNTLVEQELVDISNNNQRLCKINDTQAQLLDGLEQKITETENLVQILSRQLVAERSLYAEHYAPDKRELEDCLKVIQQLVSKQEEQHSHAIEELIIIQKWLASKNDALIEEDVFDTYLDHIPEEQDWKQAFQQLQQKTLVLERKLVETEADLDVCRQAIRNNDNSGLVGKLENDIARLETVQDSTAVNQHIEHLESVVQNLNQQLLDATHRSMEKDRQIASLQQQQQQYDTKHKSNELTVSRHRRTLSNQTTRSNNPQAEQAQLMRWIYENIDDPTGRSEVIQKFSQMSDDNAQLSMWIHDLEAQLFSERQRMAQENKSLECEVMNLALQLEKEPVKRRSRSSTQSKLERSSVLSAAEQRSRSPISSFPPPPTEPPSEPLPPVPAPSSSKKQSRVSDIVSQLESSQSKVQAQQQELTAHHGELDALKKQLENISLELENERKLKQKAEKAHQILERRIEDLMTNKKNKFRCF